MLVYFKLGAFIVHDSLASAVMNITTQRLNTTCVLWTSWDQLKYPNIQISFIASHLWEIMCNLCICSLDPCRGMQL